MFEFFEPSGRPSVSHIEDIYLCGDVTVMLTVMIYSLRINQIQSKPTPIPILFFLTKFNKKRRIEENDLPAFLIFVEHFHRKRRKYHSNAQPLTLTHPPSQQENSRMRQISSRTSLWLLVRSYRDGKGHDAEDRKKNKNKRTTTEDNNRKCRRRANLARKKMEKQMKRR